MGIKKLTGDAKVLMVGAGGIGCELLKCLAQSGFKNIEVVDMDTIEVSNLNRQFLFRREHVGKSKAEVARDSVLKKFPEINIKAHFSSIIKDEFNVPWFKKFTLVFNALDNVTARVHVNRMCLAAEVPLIDSGTAGYQGQVEVIIKGVTKCYECEPKSAPKKFPNCTIRNTPSEPIHCIVWSKNLFLQLFGEADDEAEVSPDTADPEAAGSSAILAFDNVSKETGLVKRVSTRKWAHENNYDPVKLFDKFFNEDILYLLSLEDLWLFRTPPQPLKWDQVLQGNVPVRNTWKCTIEKTNVNCNLQDQKLWTIQECLQTFKSACSNLSVKLLEAEKTDENAVLHWDKDGKDEMDFVASCTNIRSHVFDIVPMTRYDIKSMAGNIIPAVATSNAIVAGLVIFQALHVLQNKIETCRTVYLRKEANHEGVFISPEKHLSQPNPNCHICSSNPEITLFVNPEQMTLQQLEEAVFKKYFKMVQPEVTIQGPGTIIISDDCDFEESYSSNTLAHFGIREGTVLLADDFLQTCTFFICIKEKIFEESSKEEQVEMFSVVTNSKIKRVDEIVAENGTNGSNHVMQVDDNDVDVPNKYKRSSGGEPEQPLPKKQKIEV